MGILVLMALACGAALAACGSGGSTTTVVVTQPVTTQQTLPQTQTATTVTTTTEPPIITVHRSFFKSPSGNIGCAVAGGSARCDIRHRDWSPTPQPASCDLDWGQGLVVASGRANFVCAGDTTLDPSFQVLPYGQDSQVGSFTCASRTAGITCTNNNSGHGFFIARQSYRFF